MYVSERNWKPEKVIAFVACKSFFHLFFGNFYLNHFHRFHIPLSKA